MALVINDIGPRQSINTSHRKVRIAYSMDMTYGDFTLLIINYYYCDHYSLQLIIFDNN